MKGCESLQLGRQDCGQLCDDRVGGADGFMQAALRTDDRDLRVQRFEAGDEICRNGGDVERREQSVDRIGHIASRRRPFCARSGHSCQGLRIGHDPVERRGGWRPGLRKFLGLFLVDRGQRQLTGGISAVDAGHHPVGLFRERGDDRNRATIDPGH